MYCGTKFHISFANKLTPINANSLKLKKRRRHFGSN